MSISSLVVSMRPCTWNPGTWAKSLHISSSSDRPFWCLSVAISTCLEQRLHFVMIAAGQTTGDLGHTLSDLILRLVSGCLNLVGNPLCYGKSFLSTSFPGGDLECQIDVSPIIVVVAHLDVADPPLAHFGGPMDEIHVVLETDRRIPVLSSVDELSRCYEVSRSNSQIALPFNMNRTIDHSANSDRHPDGNV